MSDPLNQDTGASTGDTGVLGPLKIMLAAAVLLGVVALFGWLFVVSWLGVPWEIGFPLSVVAGCAMLAWSGGTTWRLVSVALWVGGLVWLVLWFLNR